LNVQRRLKT